MSFKEKFFSWLSSDLGIDLGTANTFVYIKGHGIVINEPSVVAVNQKTGRVVAIGRDAYNMLGRTPAHIQAIRPLVDGVISNFEVTEEMLSYFIKRAQAVTGWKLLGPRVVVGVPSGITNVEKRAVRDACRNAGARLVHLVEEPMAAAVGIRMPVHEPVGNMVVDIGGGTTDIAVISLAGLVESKNLRVAGDKLDDDIISYIRDEFKILLGLRSAEELKIKIGSAVELNEPIEMTVKGRDLVTGLPREVVITDSDVREAIARSISSVAASVKEVLEITPPEIVSDIMRRGIVLSGGVAQLAGLAKVIEEETGIKVHIAEDPMTSVVRGAGLILEDMDKFKDVLVTEEDELPPEL